MQAGRSKDREVKEFAFTSRLLDFPLPGYGIFSSFTKVNTDLYSFWVFRRKRDMGPKGNFVTRFVSLSYCTPVAIAAVPTYRYLLVFRRRRNPRLFNHTYHPRIDASYWRDREQLPGIRRSCKFKLPPSVSTIEWWNSFA